MKQYQILNAYKNIEKLSENENLTDLDQWKIYKLRKVLRPHIEFQEEREQTILEKYRPYANKDGMLEGEKMQEYVNEIQNILQLDVDVTSFVKPVIRLVKGITCIQIEQLEDFIEFTEPAE